MLAEMDARPKVFIRAQCGGRHFPWDDLKRCVAQYKRDFGLSAETVLIGRVYRKFVAGAPVDPGVDLVTALASEAELQAKTAAKAADFGELPSGLTSASSVEPSLRVEDSRAEVSVESPK